MKHEEAKEQGKVEEIDIDEVEKVLGGATLYYYNLSKLKLSSSLLSRLNVRELVAGNIAWQ